MNRHIIVAADLRYGIGGQGKIPWHFPEDLKWFKNFTRGKSCIIGRKTYEDMASYFIGKSFLPGRTAILLSQSAPNHENVLHARDQNGLEELLHKLGNDVCYIGGKGIYELGMKYKAEIYLTRVLGGYDCDTFFPDPLANGYEFVSETHHIPENSALRLERYQNVR